MGHEPVDVGQSLQKRTQLDTDHAQNLGVGPPLAQRAQGASLCGRGGGPGAPRSAEDEVTDLVELSWEGPVALLRLNRPDALNALSSALLEALGARVAEVAGDLDTRGLGIQLAGKDQALERKPRSRPAEGRYKGDPGSASAPPKRTRAASCRDTGPRAC